MCVPQNHHFSLYSKQICAANHSSKSLKVLVVIACWRTLLCIPIEKRQFQVPRTKQFSSKYLNFPWISYKFYIQFQQQNPWKLGARSLFGSIHFQVWGLKQAHFVGHSFGAFVVAWVLRYANHIVERTLEPEMEPDMYRWNMVGPWVPKLASI